MNAQFGWIYPPANKPFNPSRQSSFRKSTHAEFFHMRFLLLVLPPPRRYLSDVLPCVMRHGSGVEWSVVGAGGGRRRLGSGGGHRCGVVARHWASGPGRGPQCPHRAAAGVRAAAAVCQLSGVGATHAHTHIHTT